MTTPFDTLDSLGTLDDEIARLEHAAGTLPAALALARLEEQTADLDRQRRDLEELKRPIADRLRSLEEEVAHLEERRSVVEARLAQATGGGKDLVAMDTEAQHLRQATAQLEDTELALMEEIEPLDAALGSIGDALGPIEAERASELANLAVQERANAEELLARRAERAEMASRLEPTLLERYERAARGAKGSGAARLVDGHCAGCHLQLPSAELDRLRHLAVDELATCEQCGRLLLRTVQLEG